MKIAVIIPYKIDRGWLSEAITSVERQTYPADLIELIEVQSENTVGYNLNKGIDQAKGCDLVRYLCDDDRLTANSIADTVAHFKANPDDDFIQSNAINFWHGTTRQDFYRPPKLSPTLKDLLELNTIHGGTVTYRLRCFDRLRFNPDLWTGEEYDFNMKLLSHGYKLGYLDALTYQYRRHRLQKSLGNTATEYQAKRAKEIQRIRNQFR